jgi:hypothetical protein
VASLAQSSTIIEMIAHPCGVLTWAHGMACAGAGGLGGASLLRQHLVEMGQPPCLETF